MTTTTSVQSLPYYLAAISEATGESDPVRLVAIEEAMRSEHSTLGGLTRKRFDKLARFWMENIDELNRAAGGRTFDYAREYASRLGLVS